MLEESVYEVEVLMGKYCILGVLIVDNKEDCNLVGILINCDLCFIEDFLIKIVDVMM